MEQERRTACLTWGTALLAVVLLSAGVALALLGGAAVVGTTLAAIGGVAALLRLLPPHWHRRLLLALVSGLAALAVVEITLRLATPYGNRAILELHDRYLHCYRPGSSVVYPRSPGNGGQSIAFEVNEFGYRGPPPDVPKSRTRVVVYGDSCVSADFSNLDDTFVSRLGVHLAAGLGRPVESVNAGVNAYGPDQSLLRMQDELPGLDADLAVIVLFADNDLGDLIRNKLFRVDGDGRFVENPHHLAEGLRREMETASSAVALENLIAGTVKTPFTALPVDTPEAVAAEEARVEEWLEIQRFEYDNTVVRRDPRVWGMFGDVYDADAALEPRSPSARYKVALLEGVLRAMKATCDAQPVPLAVLVLPSPIDACTDWDCGRVNRTRFPEYRPRNITNAMRAAAERCRLPCIDLFAEYRRRGASEMYFRHGNNHWNDPGQDVAAESMAKYVLATQLLR